MHLFLAIQNLPATCIWPHRIFPKWPNSTKRFVPIYRTDIYIYYDRYPWRCFPFLNTFPFSWWWDNFLFQFLIIPKNFPCCELIARVAQGAGSIQNSPKGHYDIQLKSDAQTMHPWRKRSSEACGHWLVYIHFQWWLMKNVLTKVVLFCHHSDQWQLNSIWILRDSCLNEVDLWPLFGPCGYLVTKRIISCALELKEEIIRINVTMGIHLTVPPLISTRQI